MRHPTAATTDPGGRFKRAKILAPFFGSEVALRHQVRHHRRSGPEWLLARRRGPKPASGWIASVVVNPDLLPEGELRPDKLEGPMLYESDVIAAVCDFLRSIDYQIEQQLDEF